MKFVVTGSAGHVSKPLTELLLRKGHQAANALVSQDFNGHSFRYVISDVSGTDEIAALIGKAIGLPELKWVKFPKAEFKKVLLSYGFANGAANDYVQMF
jgi:hypothetical protein